MLSRSLFDCQSLTLNVMIRVSQFVRKSQLSHKVTKSSKQRLCLCLFLSVFLSLPLSVSLLPSCAYSSPAPVLHQAPSKRSLQHCVCSMGRQFVPSSSAQPEHMIRLKTTLIQQQHGNEYNILYFWPTLVQLELAPGSRNLGTWKILEKK